MAKKKDSAPLHEQVSVLINASQLNGLLKANRSIGKQTAELTGSLREKIAYAVEKQGLHKKAFAVLKSMDKMEPEAALEFWTHLQAYLDLSGIEKKMNSVVRMDLGEDETDVGGAPVDLAQRRKQRRAGSEEAQAEAAQ